MPGYRIVGHSLIICQANLTWSDSPVCNQIDCGSRNITNGLFNASLGTTFGKIATQSCETGYTFEGDETLLCYESGWNGTFATCILIDCGMPFLSNGIPAETPNGTTYTKMAVLACADGYTMIGNANVTCQADGNWETLPYCITEDSEVSALIAVYITVPLVVIVLVILLTVGIWRKREAKKAKGHSATHVTDTHPIIQYPNETYNDYAVKKHAGPLEVDESMAPDENYAEIDDDGVKETSENVYYNTFDGDCSKKDFDHQYDHTKATSKTFRDKNYSHITGNVSDTKFEPNYDKVQRFDTNIEPLRSDAEGGSESYEHIHIKNHDEVMKQELSIKLDEEEESNYDHAIAGGIDPVALEQDEYSHLNDANIRQRENNGEELSTPYECQYYNVSESTEESKRTGKERKAGYEEPVGHTPNYFILENNQNESEEDKHKFVLEEEENGDENDGSSNHDYFVLEKTETV